MIPVSDSRISSSTSPAQAPLFVRRASSALLGGLLLASAQAHAQSAPAEAQAEATPAESDFQPLDANAGEPVAEAEGAPEAPLELAQAAPAEEGGDNEVIVHARARIEKLQEVPVSISVVEGKELDRLGAADVSAITQRAGNISWNQGNSRTSSLSIRGLGRQAQTDAQDPSVGIIVDGLAYAYNPLSSFDLTDIESVEVTRGPQGTLLGKNATLGVLNLTTRKPTFTPEAEYFVTLGHNDRLIGRAAGGGPVISNLLAWRGTFSVDKGDGDFPNNYNEDFSYRNKDKVSGRVQFLLTPSENLDALFKFELQPRQAEYYNGWVFYTPTPTTYADGSVNPLTTDASTRLARRWFQQNRNYSYQNDYLSQRNVNLDAQQPLVTSSRGGSAVVNWRHGDGTLTSVTGWKDYYFQARNDEGTPFDASKNGGGHVEYWQLSQELRYSNTLGELADYQGGLYLLKTSNDYDSGAGFGADAGAWFATPAQYTTLDADSNGRYLMQNALQGLNQKPLQHIRNETAALFAQLNWHLSDPLTLTTGLRFTKENRNNTVSKLIYDQGYGPELNPVAVNGVQLGGFSSYSAAGTTTDGTAYQAGDLAPGNSAAQIALADSVAQKYFNVSSYSALTANQRKQVAAAKSLRQSQIGVLWNDVKGESFSKVQPTWIVSPSYKINEDLSTYFSYQYGEKAGIAQVTNGVSNLAKPEQNSSYELGFKSSLLDNTLTLNADVFYSYIKNYQQAVFVLDAYTTGLNPPTADPVYIQATGNASRVEVKGLEIDAVYSGIPYTTVRFSGAYNDATYKRFPNLGQPAENANLKDKYRDVSGQALPGAAKWTGNFGIGYRAPVTEHKDLVINGNYAFTSRYNSDITLSSYGWTKAHGIADLSVGIGTRDQKFEASIIARNLFDENESQVKTWNSFVPVPERWVGVMFTGRI